MTARIRTGTSFDLWPDLKNGVGGQRDVDELDWRHALFGEPVPDLTLEQEVLCIARWELHRTTGRITSVITPEYSWVASADINGSLGRIAATLSMRRGDLDSQVTRGGHWTPETFLDACDRGEEACDPVAYAALFGALVGFVPHMSSLMNGDLLSVTGYTFGAHCVRVALAVSDVYDTDRIARALRDVASTPTVIALALTHDAGKVLPGPGHASRSAQPAVHAARTIV